VERLKLAKRRWRGAATDGEEFGFDLEKPLLVRKRSILLDLVTVNPMALRIGHVKQRLIWRQCDTVRKP
jgi:urease accessory protein UreE